MYTRHHLLTNSERDETRRVASATHLLPVMPKLEATVFFSVCARRNKQKIRPKCMEPKPKRLTPKVLTIIGWTNYYYVLKVIDCLIKDEYFGRGWG